MLLIPSLLIAAVAGSGSSQSNVSTFRCAGRRAEFEKSCSDQSADRASCEKQIACFWVDASACAGNLAAFGSIDYDVEKVNMFLPKGKFFKSVVDRAAEFTLCTGVLIDFVDIDDIGTLGWSEVRARVDADLGQEICSLEESEGTRLQCVVHSGLGSYDGYLMKSGWVPDYANAELLEPFTEYVKDTSSILEWHDVFPRIRDDLAKYGEDIVIMPVDADFSTLVIRADAIETYQLETGIDIARGDLKTWKHLVDFVQHMDMRDFDGDGVPDFASCLPACSEPAFGYMALGGPLYMIYASFIQTRGSTEGIHFDSTTMEPLFQNEGFVEALRLYGNLSRPCTTSEPALCRRFQDVKPNADFLTGKCIMVLTHPGPANAMISGKPIKRQNESGQVIWQPTKADGSYAEARRFRVPGTTEVVARSTGKLVPCDAEACPKAEDGINRSPLINGGNVLAIRRSASQAKKEVLKDFFAYYNAPSQSLPDTATPGTWNNHWRSSHIAEDAQDAHLKKSWTPMQFRDLQLTTMDMSTVNPSLELHLRGHSEYVFKHFEESTRKHFGYEVVDGCLRKSTELQEPWELAETVTRLWEATTDTFGRLGQLIRYRKSLKLPALEKEKLCKFWFNEMEAEGFDSSTCEFDCTSGDFYNASVRACEACPPGKHSTYDSSRCLDCEAGRYNNLFRQARCQPCAPGTSTNFTGQMVCETCSMGRASPGGQAICNQCPPGFRAAKEGLAECSPCPVGQYATEPETVSCTPCGGNALDGWSTFKSVVISGESEWIPVEGALSPEECGCDVNYWLDGNVCRTCKEGMHCKGMGKFEISQHYFSPADQAGSVYQCYHSSSACPGGEPGVCAAGRDNRSIACSSCLQGYYQGYGNCLKCEVNDQLIALTYVFALIGIPTLMYFSRQFGKATPGSRLTFLESLISIILATVQQVGVLNELNVQWHEPFATVVRLASASNVNLEMFRLPCLWQLNPFSKYLLSILTPVFAGMVIVILHLLSTVCSRFSRSGFCVRKTALLSSSGTLLSAFFLPVVANILSPFRQVQHPNGVRTMLSDASVAVGTWDWEAMVYTAGITITYPVGFLLVCWCIVRSFPKKLAEGDTDFMRAVSFLIARFRKGSEAWALWVLVRGILYAIIPTVLYVAIQMMCIQTILLFNLSLVAYLRPWRSWEANLLDFASTGMLIFIVMFSSFSNDIEDAPNMAIVTTTLFVAMFATFVAALLRESLRFCGVKGQKKYAFFLSHHKAGAGNLARLFKLRLSSTDKLPGGVFIDSDDLTNLDNLFDYVGNQTGTLAVLCSAELLYRKWCVGELVTAMTRNVKTVLIRLPGFELPSQDFITQYTSAVPDIAELSSFGVSLEQVQETMHWLHTLPIIELPDLHAKSIQIATSSLVGNAMPKPRDSTSPTKHVILVDHDNLEPLAAANILADMLAISLGSEDPVNIPRLWQESTFSTSNAEADKPDSVLVVCSQGCLAKPDFIKRLQKASSSNCKLLPVLVDAAFRCPSEQATYEALRRSAQANDIDPDVFENSVRQLFMEIAFSFNPQDYAGIIEARVKQISLRILENDEQSRTRTRSKDSINRMSIRSSKHSNQSSQVHNPTLLTGVSADP
eukprot:TRINITY_DN8312_c0_g1_i4.p1 TRINITY_DN8312_c0_g1~~TRINITY_DN8312_c0_g1_i4.p1  ORF type:complete len:1606 (-),score=256.91 TRINITY_DN8312_c0_g1_i4:24-4841(-)